MQSGAMQSAPARLVTQSRLDLIRIISDSVIRYRATNVVETLMETDANIDDSALSARPVRCQCDDGTSHGCGGDNNRQQ